MATAFTVMGWDQGFGRSPEQPPLPVEMRGRGSGRPARPGPDGLPAPSYYEDTGCELAPKCLECPFPVCQYDVPRVPGVRGDGLRTALSARALLSEGRTTEDVARALGISRRTVFRARHYPVELALAALPRVERSA